MFDVVNTGKAREWFRRVKIDGPGLFEEKCF